MTPPSSWKNSSKPLRSPTVPFSERKKSPASVNKDDLFHVIHKVPSGDSPYVKAKQVQVNKVSIFIVFLLLGHAVLGLFVLVLGFSYFYLQNVFFL
jgi:hypothetical protein